MSLLYPLMALGLAAAAVPIWLHLRRRDETNLVEFSSLRFLDDQPLARTRPLWPQNWPLLLLRLLGLAALVAAFTWPYFRDEEVVVVEESRVYILDNTLSHQVNDGFFHDRDLIADELAQGEMRTQIGVIELSSTARTVVRFGDGKDAAAAKLRDLEPKAERGVFIDAFRSAGEMLGTSLGKQRRIMLLSDSQANQWTVGAESPPFLDDVELALPEVMDASPGNLSLTGSIAQRVIRDGEHWVEAGVFLQSQGAIEAEGIVFRSNGSEVAARCSRIRRRLRSRPTVLRPSRVPLSPLGRSTRMNGLCAKPQSQEAVTRWRAMIESCSLFPRFLSGVSKLLANQFIYAGHSIPRSCPDVGRCNFLTPRSCKSEMRRSLPTCCVWRAACWLLRRFVTRFAMI